MVGRNPEALGRSSPNGHRTKKSSKLAWYCLFSKSALALIGPGIYTSSGPSWSTLALDGATWPRPCSGLVLALTCQKWLAWL